MVFITDWNVVWIGKTRKTTLQEVVDYLLHLLIFSSGQLSELRIISCKVQRSDADRWRGFLVWVLRGKGSDRFLRVLCRLGFHAISSSENQLGIFLTEIPSIHPDVDKSWNTRLTRFVQIRIRYPRGKQSFLRQNSFQLSPDSNQVLYIVGCILYLFRR